MDVVVAYYYELNIADYYRNKDIYLQRFKIWAENIKNPMIVFVQKNNIDFVKLVRKNYLDRTTIINIDKSIDDYYPELNFLINRNIHKSNYDSSIFKYTINNFQAKYCEIWLLKMHYIYEASKILSKNDNIIYIDFGLTELKYVDMKYIEKYKPFDVMLDFNKFDKHKINLFKYNKNNIDWTIFQMLENNIGYIYGCAVALNKIYAEKFYNDFMDAMLACLRVGFNPVDQDIFYMLQNENNDLYNLIELNGNTNNVLTFLFGINIFIKEHTIVKEIFRLPFHLYIHIHYILSFLHKKNKFLLKSFKLYF